MNTVQVGIHRHLVPEPGKSFEALGAIWKPLVKHADPRGWFAEVWRSNDWEAFHPKQISLSMTLPGITKAFHFHRQQNDVFIPVSGAFRIVLLQTQAPYCGASIWWREGLEGGLFIPAGLAHGYRVEGMGEGKMLYLTSETYSAEDEGRLEWNHSVEGFPWNEMSPGGF